jgi:hypothetical protein
VELGRVDICLEVSMMSSHLVLPREGHLRQVFHIFAHLKKYHKNVETILRNEMGKHFELKQESIGPPKIHLGGNLQKVQLENGVDALAFSSSQYVQAAVRVKRTGLPKRKTRRGGSSQ